LGASSYYAEAEIELSNAANLTGVYAHLFDNTTNWSATDGSAITGAGAHMIASASEMIAYPNSGKLFFRTQPMVLPTNLVNLNLNLEFAFDTSGAAGSATATAKVNYIGIRKAGVG
ncbi:MAG TPA: hypothetical protein VFR09_03295, partial [Alphaproteobacteria bacterium]|nr:hypothetical protein [Alphaproteobacteria bacterium]